MSLLEPLTHTEEIKELIEDAKKIHDDALKRLEVQRERTTESLEKLGQKELEAWSDDMESFLSSFRSFKALDIDRPENLNSDFVLESLTPAQMLENIANATMNASEIAKAGLASLGSGAVASVAACGSAAMFGTASTGTAIAALSGVAKTNAMLAWLGGGAKVAGGLGMAGGSALLAGVFIVPVAAVAAVIAGKKGKAKLVEAKNYREDAKEKVDQINSIINGLNSTYILSEKYYDFIIRLSKQFGTLVENLERIKNSHMCGSDGLIDFGDLSEFEKQTVNLSWRAAEIYYRILSTPIMNEKGYSSEDASRVLAFAENELERVKKETARARRRAATNERLSRLPDAKSVVKYNWIAMLLFFAIALFTIRTDAPKGELILICAVVASPVVLVFRSLSSKVQSIVLLVQLIVSVVGMGLIATLT